MKGSRATRVSPLLTMLVATFLVAAVSVPPTQVAAADPPDQAATSSTVVNVVSAGGLHTCVIRSDGTVGCWGFSHQGQIDPPSGRYTSVVAGWSHTCAIRTDGSLACWGDDSSGQGTPPEGAFKSVGVGWAHACALRSDDAVVCWGNNDYFQSTPPSGTFTAVSAGGQHTCAIRADGTLVCWGNNDYFQSTPPSGTFTAVSAGGQHTCAIRADGTLACWGYNESGRAIPPSGTYAAVSAGKGQSCAIRADGSLACWGDNSAGQATAPAGTYASISAGGSHTCAIRADETLACWGSDDEGQVTPRPHAKISVASPWSATSVVSLTWGAVPAVAPVVSYDIQYRSAPWNGWGTGEPVAWRSGTADTSGEFAVTSGSTYCFAARAHDADGMVSGWTENEKCAVAPLDDRSLTRAGTWTLGTGSPYYRSTYLQSSTSGASLTRTGVAAYWLALLATTCPTCGTVSLSFAGTADYAGETWATTWSTTVSLYSPTTIEQKFLPIFEEDSWFADEIGLRTGTVTLKVVTSGKPVAIDGLIMTRANVAPSWADGSDPPLPAAPTDSAHEVLQLSAGGWNTCAVRTVGTLACWGDNSSGQAVPPAGTFTAVSAGNQSCAIRADGTLACWGQGMGTPAGTFTALSSATNNTCAIRTDGTLACWGRDNLEPPAGTFTAIAGDGHTYLDPWHYYGQDYRDAFCAIRTDGTLACWVATSADGNAMTPAGTFKAIDGRCAIRTDDTLVCWGDDEYDQSIPPAGSFTAVSTGEDHSCAIRTDGTLVCWGDNEYLESTPPDGTFKAVTAGEHHTCAIRTDDTFTCWGQNRSGQVTPHPTATVKALATWLSSQSMALTWTGSGLAAISSYDVRYRRAAWKGGFGSYVTWRTATTATSGTLTAWSGHTYCVSARARDADGMVSAWTPETCTAIPLDDRSLSRSSGWSAGTGSAYYRSTYLRSSTYGAKLTRTGVVAKRIALVATTCSTCGTVKVYWGSTLLKAVSLYSKTTVNKKLITVASFSSARSGTLSIKVSSRGKRVIIDGVAISRT